MRTSTWTDMLTLFIFKTDEKLEKIRQFSANNLTPANLEVLFCKILAHRCKITIYVARSCKIYAFISQNIAKLLMSCKILRDKYFVLPESCKNFQYNHTVSHGEGTGVVRRHELCQLVTKFLINESIELYSYGSSVRSLSR